MPTIRTAVAAVLLTAAALAWAADAPARKKAAAVTDRELGLSKTSVFEVPAPPSHVAEASLPGEKPLPRRLSTEIPPVIPHGITDLLPITRAENACLTCHEAAGPKVKGEPTPIPASHYLDFRNAPGKRGEHVAGARWVCISCHVPRSDAKPLVGSRFRP